MDPFIPHWTDSHLNLYTHPHFDFSRISRHSIIEENTRDAKKEPSTTTLHKGFVCVFACVYTYAHMQVHEVCACVYMEAKRQP